MNKGQAVVNEMVKHLGSWYLYGGAGPRRFDCSGLGYYSYPKAIGLRIGRVTGQQYREGAPVARSNVRPGDGIFLEPDGNGVPGHVIWVVNSTTAIEAPHTGTQVRYSNIDQRISQLRLVAIRRYTPWVGSPPKHAGLTLHRVLHKGSAGTAVRNLRRALGLSAGFYFDAKTDRAVRAFQHAHGLTVDGQVGPATAQALGWGYA